MYLRREKFPRRAREVRNLKTTTSFVARTNSAVCELASVMQICGPERALIISANAASRCTLTTRPLNDYFLQRCIPDRAELDRRKSIRGRAGVKNPRAKRSYLLFIRHTCIRYSSKNRSRNKFSRLKPGRTNWKIAWWNIRGAERKRKR